MKREVRLSILIDTEKDEFGINTDYIGFNEKTPVLNSLLVASILEVARRQELARFDNKTGEE